MEATKQPKALALPNSRIKKIKPKKSGTTAKKVKAIISKEKTPSTGRSRHRGSRKGWLLKNLMLIMVKKMRNCTPREYWTIEL
jgi:hypothetical protein